MINKNNSIGFVIMTFGLVMVASYFSNSFKQKFIDNETKDDYELVKKYLLNDSAMYGKNRPKLWIHSKYEINSRKWKNFMSRSSTDLNQPYLYLTIQSIINHCGDDFHVCLVDDESFEKLIPSWTTNISSMPEPMKSRYRDIGMLELLYVYGGMIVPNSFLCVKPLIDVYKQGTLQNTPFISEKKMYVGKETKLFMPDIRFMGAKKEDPKIQDLIQFCNNILGGHFQSENEFEAKIEKWCLGQQEDNSIQILDGQIIGVKTISGKPILLEDLMSDDYLDVNPSIIHGILIPKDEILRRPKFQYYAILPYSDVLESDSVLSKYFKSSMVDGVDEYYKKQSSMMSIISI